MLRIESGKVLRPKGWVYETLHIEEGYFTESSSDSRLFNAKGLHILPGIVDIHGDGFERQIMPRPNVSFDLELALDDTDRQLAANGITTAYLGITSSWEDGLRSIESANKIIRYIAAYKTHFRVDIKSHLRHESFNFPGVHQAIMWIDQGLVDALAFNDHTGPTFFNKTINWDKLREQKDRGTWTDEEFRKIIFKLYDQKDQVHKSIVELSKAARFHSVPMLSHDDRTPEDRMSYRNLGSLICEFPINIDAANNARDNGDSIVFGAPNVIRGGSHSGNPSARMMIEKDLCTILASDYYYPSLLQAPHKLYRLGVGRIKDLWRLVSSNPAKALGLNDRGEIKTGQRADLIIVENTDTSLKLVCTIAKGRIVYLDDYSRLQ